MGLSISNDGNASAICGNSEVNAYCIDIKSILLLVIVE